MVHPAFEPYLRRARENPVVHPSSMSAEQRRAAFRADALSTQGALAPVASREDRQLPLEGRTLRARLYVPLEERTRALVTYFHGGSFVVGDLDTHEWLCRRLATDLRTRFLAVEYRLAPEHPFPAGLDDTRDAIRYIATHRGDFGDANVRIIVMGDSAGANLVTVAATQLRDENLDLAAQVLIYPTLGPDVVTNSAKAYAHGFLLDLEHLRFDYRQYLGTFEDHTDPRVTPLLNCELSGVAPAVVVVAECDPLRDEGVAYAGLLGHFGVPVELLEAKGMVHGFLEMGGVVPEALAIVDDLAAHVERFTVDSRS